MDVSTHGYLLIVSVPKQSTAGRNAGKMRGMDYIIDRYWAGGDGGVIKVESRDTRVQPFMRLNGTRDYYVPSFFSGL